MRMAMRGAISRWTGRRRPSRRTRVTMLERLQLGQPCPQELCAIAVVPLVGLADAVVLARLGRVVDVGVVGLEVPERAWLTFRHQSGEGSGSTCAVYEERPENPGVFGPFFIRSQPQYRLSAGSMPVHGVDGADDALAVQAVLGGGAVTHRVEGRIASLVGVDLGPTRRAGVIG